MNLFLINFIYVALKPSKKKPTEANSTVNKLKNMHVCMYERIVRDMYSLKLKRIGVNVRLEVIQKTALLGTAKILRKVLSL